ncbi:hypothetical protein AAIR98_001272 [Elusimicrobium simillimum]|uniref:hypothetical protein n=1 Tax=Elusimicrobium simillimum TaxID=3143438 RepID=UPI003C6F0667
MKKTIVLFVTSLMLLTTALQAAEPMKMTTYYPTPYASYSTVTVGETNVGTETGGGALTTQNLNITTLDVAGTLSADNVTQLKTRNLRVGPAAGTSGGKLKASKIKLNADLETTTVEAAQAHIVDTIDFGGKIFPYAKAAAPAAERLVWKEIVFKGLDGKKKKGTFLAIDVENTCAQHTYAVPYNATEEISQYEIEVVAACQFLGYPVPSDIFVTDDVDVIDETFRYCEALIEANLCDDNEEALYTCETLEPKRCIDVMSVPGGTVDLTAETGEWNWIPFNGFQGIALPYTPGKRSAAASTSSGTGSTTPQLRAGGYTQFPPGVELEIGPGGGGIQAVLPCEYWQDCSSRSTEYLRQLCARMHNMMCPTTLQLPDTIKLRMVSCCDEYTPEGAALTEDKCPDPLKYTLCPSDHRFNVANKKCEPCIDNGLEKCFTVRPGAEDTGICYFTETGGSANIKLCQDCGLTKKCNDYCADNLLSYECRCINGDFRSCNCLDVGVNTTECQVGGRYTSVNGRTTEYYNILGNEWSQEIVKKMQYKLTCQTNPCVGEYAYMEGCSCASGQGQLEWLWNSGHDFEPTLQCCKPGTMTWISGDRACQPAP